MLHELCNQSWWKNKEHGITGYLYHKSGYFLQYFEGKRAQVDKLLEVVSNDPRHSVMFSLDREVQERRFPKWHMQFMTNLYLTEINLEGILFDYMKLFNKPWFNHEGDDRVWEIMDKISYFRNRLADKLPDPPC